MRLPLDLVRFHCTSVAPSLFVTPAPLLFSLCYPCPLLFSLCHPRPLLFSLCHPPPPSSDESDSQSGTEDEGVGTEDPLAAMKEKLAELNTCKKLCFELTDRSVAENEHYSVAYFDRNGVMFIFCHTYCTLLYHCVVPAVGLAVQYPMILYGPFSST